MLASAVVNHLLPLQQARSTLPGRRVNKPRYHENETSTRAPPQFGQGTASPPHALFKARHGTLPSSAPLHTKFVKLRGAGPASSSSSAARLSYFARYSSDGKLAD